MKTLEERMASWPASPDRASWLAALEQGDGFSDPGPGAELRPISARAYTDQYTKYLDFLQRHHGCIPDAERVGARLVIEDLHAFWKEMKAKGRAPITIRNVFMGILQVVRLCDPKSDRTVLEAVIAKMVKLAKPIRDIDSRILPPDVIIRKGAELIALAEAGASRKPTLTEAVMYRNGALLIGGILCPLRPANWAMTVIGHHVHLDEGDSRFTFAALEMKGRKDRTFPIPPELTVILRRYIDRYRPVLLHGRRDTGHLWLSFSGRQMKPDVLSDAVRFVMEKRIKKHFTVQNFRHSAASFVAEVAPERARVASKALDHDRFSTTARHYIRGQQRNTLRKYHVAVKATMRKGKRPRARKATSSRRPGKKQA
jgi:integrase